MNRFLVAFATLFLLGLAPGDPAPDFTLKNQDGKAVKLSDFKGKPVLVYFYPKDDTPGCTKEACALRDSYSQFTKQGAVILGVSAQDEKSHQQFRKKHKLPFDLLVDKDGAVGKKFGVNLIEGAGVHERKSVLIGRDGKVLRVYDTVDPAAHAGQVLKDLGGA